MNRSFAAFIVAAAAAQFAQAQNFEPRPPRQVSSQAKETPPGPPPNIGELMRHSNGSLYAATAEMPDDPRLIKASDVSFFSVPDQKPKTMIRHDLVTIIVHEQTSTSSTGTTDLKKDAAIDAKLAQFPALSLSNFALKAGIGAIQPEVNLTGSRSTKNQGTVDRQDSFETRIQAEVVDVKPNGTLVVQARKRIVNDEEQQVSTLTGTCRVQDVTADNTVLSTQLFDLEVQNRNTGALRDTTKRGWVPRVLDWINPF